MRAFAESALAGLTPPSTRSTLGGRRGSAGCSKARILFAFDPERRAVLLAVGDKADGWRRRYDRAIPVADDRFDERLDSEEE
ncbi:MAG: type II toxin-antitoxin system RelE/ParE family toxin [Bifidobacteriaceae bacterium]|nr:type II toxin-antitoxin system RelE/ParE family toxin [Bifidobacteriaceae bacterium]